MPQAHSEHFDELACDLTRIGCNARDQQSAELQALEHWTRIGSDLCIGFAIGFIAVAVLM